MPKTPTKPKVSGHWKLDSSPYRSPPDRKCTKAVEQDSSDSEIEDATWEPRTPKVRKQPAVDGRMYLVAPGQWLTRDQMLSVNRARRFGLHRKPALPCLGDAELEVKDLVRVSDDVLQELIDLDAKVLLPRDATQKQIDACDDGSITTTNLKILALKAFAEAYIATKCVESEGEDEASVKTKCNCSANAHAETSNIAGGSLIEVSDGTITIRVPAVLQRAFSGAITPADIFRWLLESGKQVADALQTAHALTM
ncbi:uncharacterized protein SCHCODRAFT_01209299 [Schizophyllum commune H4-8]|nr:uncharacterized protein SCHCODRAFT_01209299 [Schizophyllum commune H4-8]KAI5897711.1 hypothetical protein SCHCODRAFT_01209299 [Schizophyllum commune H4-8]